MYRIGPKYETSVVGITIGVIWFIVIFLAALFLFVAFLFTVAHGQENHLQHHAQYENWQSNAGFGCCNNNDCGMLPDKDVREKSGQIEVLIKDPAGDQWCLVTENHLINQKNGPRPSPDWSSAHACILASFPNRTACDRFKCFMPAVKF